MRSEAWQRLRQGARNVAGVTYQLAVTVDVLVAGVAARPGHPSVISVLPEGLEDIDLNLFGGGKLFVQAKERAPGSQNLGASAVAEVVVHAALNMLAAGELGGSARIGLVTDCTLAAGLVPTGWAATVLDTTAPAALVSLEEAVKERLTTAGVDPTLSRDLLRRTSIVYRPWNHSDETRNDLARAYSVEPAVAWLAFTVLIERVARLAAEQRSTQVDAPVALTATDVGAVVDSVAAAVDLRSLNEAVTAGVCASIDFLEPSDRSPSDFLQGVDAAPSHIAAGLDVVREKELAAILDGLAKRHHVLLVGPSGSGKSTLLWRAAKILTLGARVVRVFRVSSDEDVVVLVRHVQRTKPSQSAPVLLCADNVGSADMTMWTHALKRVLEIPGVFVISTVRREDYMPTLALDGVVVDSKLEQESAAAIFTALLEAGLPTTLEIEEAVERADGLLMEFIALATTGRRLREVLRTQVHALRTVERSLERNVLRLVCAGHTLGWSMDAGRLAAVLSPADPALVGDALSRLEGEHLVIQDLALGEWRGLHDLRAEIIQEILHESPPPTLATTLCEAISLLAPLSRPSALVRAAELLARRCAIASLDGPPSLDRFVAALRPLAELVRDLLADPSVPSEDAATYCSRLLQVAVRLDVIAYANATLPLVEASCPRMLDAAELACQLYTVRVDGMQLPDMAAAQPINALAGTLPPFDSQLSLIIGQGLDGARLVKVAGDADLVSAVDLLEAAEGFVVLDSTQARQAWQQLIPALPDPPGEGFDPESADLTARIACVLASLARLTGPEVAEALGPVQRRAEHAVACDPDAATVSLRLQPRNETDDTNLPRSARRDTWSPTEILVAEASFLYREEIEPVSGYLPLPGEGQGVNRRVVGVCRRLLDACPEVDRADVAGVGHNWKPIGYGDMVFGKKSIRSGVLRVRPSIRRNIAYQAAVARMRMAKSWSARLRQQSVLAKEVLELLRQLPRRLRPYDNPRRAREWSERVSAAGASAAALPRRPPAESEPTTATGVLESDEASRAPDPEQAAFGDLAQGLASASRALASGERTQFHSGAYMLGQALTKLQESRAAGVPTFAAVDDPLPLELDQLVKQAEQLLRACATSDDSLRLIRGASSDAEVSDRVAAVAAEQERSDGRLLAGWLQRHGVEGAKVVTLPDPQPLASRLNSSRTAALVDSVMWASCAEALWASPPGDWGEVSGRLVVVASHEGKVLPIGLSAVGAAGTWMPIVDPEDFDRIGADAGVPVVNGPYLALLRNALKDLVAWSGAVQLRARRPTSWFAPPMPTPTPTEIAHILFAALASHLGSSKRGRAVIEQVIALADSVATEGGSTLGLAGHFVDSVTSPGPTTSTDEMTGVVLSAIEADLETTPT